ncbi:TolB family protein [Nonomuraea aridisoli]|uniref:WD40 repeat domain-containing protein n=1 Tax=Nonomuraea aridisoli TaxID=2070368 RepID=A0A2W2F4Y9_9ACTN|nr:hypothetical protein [Nonomuraea aridisoli]PZG16647.1 hypothetical protein C1J01_20485 [Nonomuraea aridisoli]
MRTEDELVEALRSAAGRAPGADELLAGVARRRRRRTRRRVSALAAAAAVVVVAAGVRGVVWDPGGVDAVAPTSSAPRPTVTRTLAPPPTAEPRPTVTLTITARPTGSAPPGRSKVVPAEMLWPGAYFTMPARDADGWRRRPIMGIGAAEVLLFASGPGEKTGRLEVYDSVTGEIRAVTTPRTDGMTGALVQVAAADGENLVWTSYGEKDGTSLRQIWTAPLTGKAKLLATVSGLGSDIDMMQLDGDHVVWSERSRGGVWRMPLAGGTPRRLPGGDGLHLVDWPVAGDVAADPGPSVRNQTLIADLTRGTKAAVAVPPGAKGLRCGRTWCTGHDDKGGFLQRFDGTAVTRLDALGSSAQAPARDRFVYVRDGVYDIATGKVAVIDADDGAWFADGGAPGPGSILYWENERGTLGVLNLAAVPPAQ